MTIEKRLITPELAVLMLTRNTNNRKISEHRISRYVNDIINDRWVEDTAEMIKIDKNNQIIDGQHRLTAIVRAKKSVNFYIATGLDTNVFEVIDSGKTRSQSDVLKIANVPNASRVSAFIQYYNQFKNTNSRASSIGVEISMTSKMVLKFYKDNEEWVKSVIQKSAVFYAQFQQVMNFSDIALFYALFTDVDKVKGYDFIRQLCQGTDITNDVVILLRNKLISDKVNRNNKMTIVYRKAIIIKCWNAFYLEKNLKVLKFNNETESFPEIIGY